MPYHFNIEIKKIWTFEIKKKPVGDLSGFADILINGQNTNPTTLFEVAKNDGLEYGEMLGWFKYPRPFIGQILCWNESIEY